ncbi:MAG: hypothetical protein SGJ10_10420 [Bacteroidota bacterium]|nr:hypothetical protein [Bacteroidota bacterium]
MKNIIYIILLVSVFTSCKNDIAINAEWKETAVVYALLDANEPIHYIRVEKSFLNTGSDAVRVAGVSDSIYFDTLEVAIRIMDGSTIVQNINFYPDYNAPKQQGVFASTDAVLYTSIEKLSPTASYNLHIKNPRTGKEYTSNTSMVYNSFIQTKTSMFSLYPNQTIAYYFYTGKKAYEYEATLTLHYAEYDSVSNQLLGRHSFSWVAAKNIFVNDPKSSRQVKFDLDGGNFFNQIASNIPKTPGVWRSMDTCDVLLYGAGEELSNYIALNKPSLSIVQKKSDYSNINNGLGIFSSRNTNHDQIGLPISDSTKYYIYVSPITAGLGFRKP